MKGRLLSSSSNLGMAEPGGTSVSKLGPQSCAQSLTQVRLGIPKEVTLQPQIPVPPPHPGAEAALPWVRALYFLNSTRLLPAHTSPLLLQSLCCCSWLALPWPQHPANDGGHPSVPCGAGPCCRLWPSSGGCAHCRPLCELFPVAFGVLQGELGGSAGVKEGDDALVSIPLHLC